MDTEEQITQKRIKSAKVFGMVLLLYSAAALMFFALNAINVLDVLGASTGETGRLMESSAMGTCGLGVASAIICFIKIGSPNWYGIIYVFFVCTAAFSVFVILSYLSQTSNFVGAVVMIGCAVFAFICASILKKLKNNTED